MSNKPIPEDAFRAVERRVWWGLLIGLGLLFTFHHQLEPWTLTLAATGATLTLGIMVARSIGIVIDGSTPKQWMWMGVELLMFVAFVSWYVKNVRNL